MTEQVSVITVDGPSGSGKGTVCKRLAATLGWHLLDSGALYRVLGIAAARHQVALDDEPALVALAAGLDVQFIADPADEVVRVVLEGDDVSGALRTEEAGSAASVVAAIESVRAALLQRQRDFALAPGLVADGRDMGTVVFPAAPLKIYLTASAEERARRRYNQLIGKGGGASLQSVLDDIKARDDRDMNRPVAPLKPADDAVVLDTTELGIEDVLGRISELVKGRLAP
ncbi:(d)CMP kinase [Motiliproteus sediminis]|uniref:(d)CMP kinase n=1 Tax=Motiliproteus sediminis TaxID=1468178 RepID=UPI001AEFCE1D|nr:(d)CMP kinase [Motiliproteus sediminis]